MQQSAMGSNASANFADGYHDEEIVAMGEPVAATIIEITQTAQAKGYKISHEAHWRTNHCGNVIKFYPRSPNTGTFRPNNNFISKFLLRPHQGPLSQLGTSKI